MHPRIYAKAIFEGQSEGGIVEWIRLIIQGGRYHMSETSRKQSFIHNSHLNHLTWSLIS